MVVVLVYMIVVALCTSQHFFSHIGLFSGLLVEPVLSSGQSVLLKDTSHCPVSLELATHGSQV